MYEQGESLSMTYLYAFYEEDFVCGWHKVAALSDLASGEFSWFKKHYGLKNLVLVYEA